MESILSAFGPALIPLLTLTAMEIVLGIDNIVFLSILVGRLPPEQRERARKLGLSLALVMRLGLLLSLSWLMRLTEPFFTLFDHGFSGRDLILLGGGLFLIGKSTFEIHHKVEAADEPVPGMGVRKGAAFGAMLLQIVVVDLVFSLDSVITAVGMANELWIMVTAMILSMLVMLLSARHVGEFVDRHPSVKLLALSFLLLIGVMLLVEGMGGHIGKGYIYFAMAFSLGVELLNLRYHAKRKRAK